MFQRLFIFLVLVNFGLAQNNILTCDLQYISKTCRCTMTIHNPNGNDNFIIHGNPTTNCTLDDVDNVIVTGLTTNVPSIICKEFPKLTKLTITNIGLTNFDLNPFQSCANLKELYASNNKISKIISYTFSNTKLVTLELGSNTLKNLDDWTFDGLQYLTRLVLSSNAGIILPANIFRPLQSLTYLSLSSCQLTEIKAAWFDTLINLTTLYLNGNKIKSVPSTAFQHATKLTGLYLYSNTITAIPESTFQYNVNLQTLSLYGNQIAVLPSRLFANQKALKTLSIYNNKFTQIASDVFSSLIALESLDMNNCNISEIGPQWFATTKKLKTINLSSNNIPEIPVNSFTSTDSLATINFQINKIKKIDSKSFGSLKSLASLNFQRNELNEIDHHFLNQSTVLKSANFLNNLCASLSTTNFVGNKTQYMVQLRGCFDNFDKIAIHLETFNSTSFDWHNIRYNDDWKAINVTIKARENVHIGLTDMLGRPNPLIEIRIGVDEDHESQIWEQNEKVFINRVRDRLSETEERTFIIGWNYEAVLVFRQNDRLPFMIYGMRNPFNVNFFGLRTIMDPYNTNNKAVWKVLRIHGNPSVEMKNIYDDIQKKRMMKIPINLENYLLKNV